MVSVDGMILMTKAEPESPVQSVTIPKFEAWRKGRGLSMAEVGKKIGCAHDTIWRAENGKPIRKKFIDRLVQLGDGAFGPEDFVQQKQREAKVNGKKSERKVQRKRKPAARRKRARNRGATRISR